MKTNKSSKNNLEASYNSSNFAENDTNYITQKQFYTKKISEEHSPNFESDEFNTFKKSNTFNSNNNLTATFYKKSKNSNEEVKDDEYYINEKRKRKVLNMIKNSHVEKLKNYIYLKEINFAYEEMQRYLKEGDFASAKEMERYLNSLQIDIIRHNIESFSKTKLGKSHATFGQSYNSNFSNRKNNNIEKIYNSTTKKVSNRNYIEENYEEEENIKKNKTKKRNKTKGIEKKYRNNNIVMNIPNNISQNNNQMNYKTYEYDNNIPQKSYINSNDIYNNNIPNNENINYIQPNQIKEMGYSDNTDKNQIIYNEQNNENNNAIIVQKGIYDDNIESKYLKDLNEENPNEQEINPENEQEINQDLVDNDNNNDLNPNQNLENKNINNFPINQNKNEMNNINQNIENKQINNNIIPNSELNPDYQKPNVTNQIENIPNEQNNKEYSNKEDNTPNQSNQIPKESNIEVPIYLSKISAPENNYQKQPYNNYNQLIPQNNNNIAYYPDDNIIINNNIPFNPDNAIPNNIYPNYDDINNKNPNNINNIYNYPQKPENDLNEPNNKNKNKNRINPKQVLRNPKQNNNKIKRPKSSKGPLINTNNNYILNIPDFTYPRKYYEKSKSKSRSKSTSRNRSNTPKILFAEPSKGKCFACDVNCSISRSGNSPNKYVPYYGPLKKERKHITEYDGEKYGYYQYKSRIPEIIEK